MSFVDRHLDVGALLRRLHDAEIEHILIVGLAVNAWGVSPESRREPGVLEPRTASSSFEYGESPAMHEGFRSAPERTRTSTDHKVHKALNLNRPA